MDSEGSRDRHKNRDLVINIILSILLPPLAVYRMEGVGDSFWICVLLTLLVIIPGTDLLEITGFR